MRRLVGGLATLLSLALAFGAIAWTHRLMGGDLRLFIQPEALAVVLGGTTVAVLISFPSRARHGAVAHALGLARRRISPVDDLVQVFVALAYTARRQGWAAIEGEIARMKDPFLARALTLTVSGLEPEAVRETLEAESRVAHERDEEHAQVFDAAARYAPTLGLLGALLALLRAIQLQAWSTDMARAGGAALVAIVYGVALASLICQPLAARLRARARAHARCRDLTIRGVLALRDGAAPSVVEERLSGFLQTSRGSLANVA
jgi:chemotaxis protein MotA